jgi:hypothetical protein
VAAFTTFLRDEGIIRDLNQVAILLYSVRAKYSRPYIQALKKRGIDSIDLSLASEVKKIELNAKYN